MEVRLVRTTTGDFAIGKLTSLGLTEAWAVQFFPKNNNTQIEMRLVPLLPVSAKGFVLLDKIVCMSEPEEVLFNLYQQINSGIIVPTLASPFEKPHLKIL